MTTPRCCCGSATTPPARWPSGPSASSSTYCEKARYIDVHDLELPGIPASLRPVVSPIVVGALANRLAQHYEAVRGHDLETRRYMFKVDY